MSFRLYVCLSVCQVYWETWFSWPLIEISLQFFCADVSHKHLFCKYFVRLSVGNASKVLLLGCFHPCLLAKLLFNLKCLSLHQIHLGIFTVVNWYTTLFFWCRCLSSQWAPVLYIFGPFRSLGYALESIKFNWRKCH